MFIQANTITQVSLLCLIGFLLTYLWLTARQHRLARTDSTWSFIHALRSAFVVIALTSFEDLFETWHGDVIIYARSTFAVLFYYHICLFFYRLPPISSVNRREMRIFSTIGRLLVGVELLYMLYRGVHYWQVGTYLPRPLWAQGPIIGLVLWTMALSLRRLMAAERAAIADLDAGPGQNRLLKTLFFAGRSLFSPVSRVGRIYRWFALMAIVLLFVVFVFAIVPYQILPLWVDIGLDGALTAGVTLIVFVYLRYQMVPISLELRLLGAGLTLFLLLAHLLSWGISLTYLAQELPGVSYAQVFGSAQQPDFLVPAAYREIAQQLGSLLLVLIFFQVGGSLLFVLLSAIFYRQTFINTLAELLAGFDHASRGDLAYRIPQLVWQDEFSRIAAAFNSMADTLQTSSQEVQRYQEELENLVQERTSQLAEEIEQRKTLEVMQGIQAERNRIAQETHDGLLQSLAGVRIRLRRSKKLSRRSPELIESELNDMAEELSHSALSLRRMINDLKLDILELGLETTIRRVLNNQQRAYGVRIQARINFGEVVLPIATQLSVLRLVQEGVSNACKHSDSDQIWVTVHENRSENALRIIIKDGGIGFDSSLIKSRGLGGWGLGNMEQRVQEIGGTLKIQSRPGTGTHIQICVPLALAEDMVEDMAEEMTVNQEESLSTK